ncbi:short chain dehydrogenase [compost metagenome]
MVWLGSEASQAVTGQMFEVEGGKLSIADGWRRGPEFDKGARYQPEEVGEVVERLLADAVPAQKVYGA